MQFYAHDPNGSFVRGPYDSHDQARDENPGAWIRLTPTPVREQTSDNDFTPRKTYRERREARAERLRGWAEKREQKAEAAFTRSHELADMIPFGQPVLAGHHSQGRHLRDIDRIRSSGARGIEHADKAASMRSRADNIEAQAEHAIYSDDVDAIERLEERIAELEAERSRIKSYNASCRKGSPDPSLLDEKQRSSLATALKVAPYSCKNGAFPGYGLTNLSGNINRNRKRMEALKRAAA